MQLVAYGAQDVYLTGNPQITFFKIVYRRHTNFSVQCIEIPIDGAKFGSTATVQVLRSGDLANKMYIKTTLPGFPMRSTGSYINNVGFALIKNIECLIGGSRIDRHFGLFYDVWHQLTHTEEQEDGLNRMIGNIPELTNIYNQNYMMPEYTLYIPLQFWFNRNIGLSLPLIALQYHDVRFNIEFEKLESLLNSCSYIGDGYDNRTVDYDFDYAIGNNRIANTSLLVDYIFLDQEERRRMAQVGHEYLIEQLQYNDCEVIAGANQKFLLDFNHPCKEVLWVTQNSMYNKKNTFLAHYSGNLQETLDFAATNIARQMITYLRPDQEAQGLYKEEDGWFKISDFLSDELIKKNSTSSRIIFIDHKIYNLDVAGIYSNPIKINLVINNTTSDDLSFDNYRYYYINNEILKYNNSLSLSEYIKEVTYYFTIYEFNNGNRIILNDNKLAQTLDWKYLMNVKHDLNIEDISIPVDLLTKKFIYNKEVIQGFASGIEYYEDGELFTNLAYNDYFNIDINQPFNYGLDLAGNGNMVSSAKLLLNNTDRFDKQDGNYFNYVQPVQHHTRAPKGGIYCYSFGLHPEQHQPSGTCNFSRIDTALLVLTFKDTLRARYSNLIQVDDIIAGSHLHIFAINYNVLRIMSGMSGVAYAN